MKRKRQEETEQLKEAGRKIDAYMEKMKESDTKKEVEKKEKAESEFKSRSEKEGEDTRAQDEKESDECECEEDKAEDEGPAEDPLSDSGVGQTETDDKQADELVDTNTKKPAKKGKKKWVSIPGEFWV
jgi:hypothetical protein